MRVGMAEAKTTPPLGAACVRRIHTAVGLAEGRAVVVSEVVDGGPGRWPLQATSHSIGQPQSGQIVAAN